MPTAKTIQNAIDLSNVKNITQPDDHGIQVRIQHDGKEHSKYFSFSYWEKKPVKQHTQKAIKLALQSAIKWRDDMKVILGKKKSPSFRTRALSNNQSTGIAGISRYKKYDRRKDCYYDVYSVSWSEIIDGQKKRRVTAFNIGRLDQITPEKENEMLEKAVRFRRQWEDCQQTGSKFDPKQARVS